MKRVTVNRDLCEANGQCIISAPQIFSFDQDDQIQWVEEFEETDLGDVEDAVESCPTRAISIQE